MAYRPLNDSAYRALPSAQLIAKLRGVPHRAWYIFAETKGGSPIAVALEFRRPGAKAPFAVIDYSTSPATVRRLGEIEGRD